MDQHIIIVHGMGEAKKGDFKKTFKDSIKEALKLYEIENTWSNNEKFIIGGNNIFLHEFAYNKFFNARRKLAKNAGETLDKKLPAIIDDKTLADQLASELVNMNEWLGSDDFFQTHWLDVLLYRYTADGQAIQVALAKEIARVLKIGGVSTSNLHVVGHSLGTAVVHDTLHKLYSEGVKLRKNSDPYKLGTDTKIDSVSMFANCSEVLARGLGPHHSKVKPGDAGCVQNFFQFNHALDPIPRVMEFVPKDGGWVEDMSVLKRNFAYKEATDITAANVHDITHYLKDPENHILFMEMVMKISDQFTDAKIRKGIKAFKKDSLHGQAEEIKSLLKDIMRGDVASMKNLSKSVARLLRFVKSMGEEV